MNDRSSLGNGDSNGDSSCGGTGVVGVEGGVMIVDAAEALRLLSERDDGDRKLVPSVDTEPRLLSNTLV